MKVYGRLYKRVTGFDLTKCAYCDGPREVLDHVPPISVVDNIDLKEYFKSGGKLLLYPSCIACNKYLSSYKSENFYDRLDYLVKRLSKKVDSMELWEENELKEMGRMMRSYILGKQYRIRELVNKLFVIENKRLGIEPASNEE